MKSKWFTYTLLGAAILVWSWVCYSIYTTVSGSDDQTNVYTAPEKKQRRVNEEDSVQDVYNLLAQYRDPFLSSSVGNVMKPIQPEGSANKTSASKTIKKEVVVKQPVVFVKPDIQYLGRIHNNNGKAKPLGILVYDSKEYMLQEGELLGAFIIEKIWKDSVSILVDKQKIYVRKTI